MSATQNHSYLATAPTDPRVVDGLARDRGLDAVVVVLSQTPPAEWLDDWSGTRDPMVVDLTGRSGSSLRLPGGESRVVAGLSPPDLTGVSMVLDSLVDRHDRLLLYFESLSGLSRCASSIRTAHFFRRTVQRVTRAGGTVVADVDPSAHGTSDLRTLSAPFERLVESPPATSSAFRQS